VASRQELRGRSTARREKEQRRLLLQEATTALIRQEAGERARRQPEQAQRGPCEAAKERGNQRRAGRSTRGAEVVRSIACIKLSWRGRRSHARRAAGVAAPLHQTHPRRCCPMEVVALMFRCRIDALQLEELVAVCCAAVLAMGEKKRNSVRNREREEKVQVASLHCLPFFLSIVCLLGGDRSKEGRR